MSASDLYKAYARTTDNLPPEQREKITEYVKHLIGVIDVTRLHLINVVSLQCKHPRSALVIPEDGQPYCGQCADDSLRANIAAGVEA